MEKKCNPIRTQVLMEVLKRNFHNLPVTIRYKILADMERYKFISKKTRWVYRINYKTPEELKKIERNLFE